MKLCEFDRLFYENYELEKNLKALQRTNENLEQEISYLSSEYFSLSSKHAILQHHAIEACKF